MQRVVDNPRRDRSLVTLALVLGLLLAVAILGLQIADLVGDAASRRNGAGVNVTAVVASELESELAHMNELLQAISEGATDSIADARARLQAASKTLDKAAAFVAASAASKPAPATAAATTVDPYSKAAYVPVTMRSAGIDYTADYCVIGAGVSGVKAIETLVVEGGATKWLLLEAQNRIGGRLETATVGTGASAYQVEEHAQWVQGDLRNPILALAAEMQPPLQGGNARWEEYAYYDANGQAQGYNQGSSLGRAMIALFAAYDCVWYDLAPQILNGSIPDMSLTDCYATCGWKPITLEDFAIESAFVAVEWGEDSEITSCANAAQWVAYTYYGDDAKKGTANFVTDARGLSSVVEHILRRKNISLADPRIHYNTLVSNVDTTNNIITARRNGVARKYQCKFVINTMGIGALQTSLREGTNLVTPLPSTAVQASIHKYHMGFYRKTFLQFKTKFWGDEAHFVITPKDPGFMVTSWTSLDYPLYYPGSRILLVSHNGPDSNRFNNLPDEEYVRRICDELVRIFGPAANFSELTVNGWYVGHDPTEPRLFGSYSNRPATISPQEFRAMWAPVKGHYIPSGEAACDSLNGYVVGGYWIGQSAARRALVNAGVLPVSVNPEDNDCFRPPPGWVP
jgi:protoporphyrinogen oxidase